MKNHGHHEPQFDAIKFGLSTWTLLFGTCVLLLLPGMASTQERVGHPAPMHSHVKGYGNGWVCNSGYQLSADKRCVEVKVPDNAFPSFGGQRWACHR